MKQILTMTATVSVAKADHSRLKDVDIEDDDNFGVPDSETPEQTCERLQILTHKTLARLSALWREIGFAPNACHQRCAVLSRHVQNLLRQMVNEEEALVDRMHNNVRNYSQQVTELAKELAVPEELPQSSLCLLEREMALRSRISTLSHEKKDRCVRLSQLRERDQKLADLLYATPYYLATGAVPTATQLKELEAHVNSLQAEKEERQKTFRSMKKDILQFYDDNERSCETSFERDIVSEAEQSFMLTSDKMASLKELHAKMDAMQKSNFAEAAHLRDRLDSLWKRLQIPAEEMQAFSANHTGFKPSVIRQLSDEVERCEKLKIQNLRQVIASTCSELRVLWDKCFISVDEQRLFTPATSDDVSEERLQQIDMEVMRMKKYYEDNAAMLELVVRRQLLWEQFIECERKAADPNRFFNRGGTLLKEEKERKKITKELPKVEQQVSDEIAQWERDNEREFRVQGQRFIDFIRSQWDEYHRQKDSEKHERQQARAKQNVEEVLFGSKPTTPAKRRFLTTMSKTPTKRRECTIDTPLTPASVKRLRTTQQAAPGLSVFSPASHPPSNTKAPRHEMTRSRAGRTSPRRALIDKNVPQTTFNSTVTSSSTVNGGSDGVATSLAPLEPYQEFERGLNSATRQNCRSSVIPPKSLV